MISVITLVSGGLDSSLMSLIIKESEIVQLPLFIDYGQLSLDMEWAACKKFHSKYNLLEPAFISIKGFGQFFPSGITDRSKDIKKDAFLPNRNALFLLIAASYAFQKNANTIAIGFLNESTHLFPDQTDKFLKKMEIAIKQSLGVSVNIVTPLREFYKKDVVELAKLKGITGTYSCHSGADNPCGKCISCEEFHY